MTDTAFRPVLYLLDDCPFCFKVRLFLLEARLTDQVDIQAFAAATPEQEAARAAVAAHLAKVSFPAAELEPGRFVAESDDIIAFLAKGSGNEPASMPTLRLYLEGPMHLVSKLWQENVALKAAATKSVG